GPLLYVFVLGIFGGILKLLNIFFVVLHHGIHIGFVQIAAAGAVNFRFEVFGVIGQVARQNQVFLLCQLLQLVERLGMVFHHHLRKPLDLGIGALLGRHLS